MLYSSRTCRTTRHNPLSGTPLRQRSGCNVTALTPERTVSRAVQPQLVAVLAAVVLSVASTTALAASADQVLKRVHGQVLAVDVLVDGQLVDSSSGVVVRRGAAAVPCNGMP